MKFDLSLPILSIRSRLRLTEMVHAMFAREGSAEQVGVDKAVLDRFIDEISRGYRPNPYHNLNHATDALNTMGWFVTRPTFARNFTPWIRFLLMVSTLVHDVDHPGNDNQWEIKTQSSLAHRFDNKSVLEQRSVEVTRQLLSREPTNLFRHLPAEQQREGMALIEQYVLATDFARHQDFLERLGKCLASGGPDYDNEHSRSLIACSLIKAADIANTAKPYHLARPWGSRVMQEFWAQGFREQAQHLEVGPLNDASAINVYAAQAGFIKYACLELFELLSQVEEEISVMVNQLRENISRYESTAERYASA